MDDFKIGDIVICIGNLSIYRCCDELIGKVGKIDKIIDLNFEENTIGTTTYYEKYNKLFLVKFCDKCGSFISKEIIKCSL